MIEYISCYWLDFLQGIVQILIPILALGLAFFTYSKARATLFQPKRAEAIKKETELIDDFFKHINENGESIDNALDYMNLVRYNIEFTLRNNDLIQGEFLETRQEEYNEKILNWFVLNDDPASGLQYFIGNVHEYDYFFNKKAPQESQQEPFVMKSIILTRTYVSFHKQLSQLTNHAFISVEIQKVANKIGDQILYNLRTVLVEALSTNYSDFLRGYLAGDNPNAVSLRKDVWKDFEAKRLSHKESFDELIRRVRKYYLIDKKWGS